MTPDEEKAAAWLVERFDAVLSRTPRSFHDWYCVADHFGLVLAEVDTTLPFRAAWIGELICVPPHPPEEGSVVIASALARAILRHPKHGCPVHTTFDAHKQIAQRVGNLVTQRHQEPTGKEEEIADEP